MTIGEAVWIRHAEEKVKGTLAYADALPFADLLHVKLLRSPHPHARITSLDSSEAEQHPGVIAVLTRDNIMDVAAQQDYGLKIADQPIVAYDVVRHVGEPVAAVVAESTTVATSAVNLIKVTYEQQPAVFTTAEARADDAPLLHPQRGSNLLKHGKLRHGDIDAGFAEADLIVEETYTSPTAHHATLEPHTAIAQWQGDQLTVWSTTQAPFPVRKNLAAIFGLPPVSVRVIVPPLGGGYGGKGHVRIEPLVATAARLADGRPVKLALTRRETYFVNSKHAAQITLKSGVKADGTLTARQVTLHWSVGAYADVSPLLVNSAVVRSLGPYKIPNVHVDSYGYYTNTPTAGAFRGAMSSQTTWAYESHMDSIAQALGMDPYEFRLKNILHDDDQFATGEHLHDVHFERCLTSVVDKLNAIPQEAPPQPYLRRGRGHAVMMKSTIAKSKSEAKATLSDNGQIVLSIATVEMGQGAQTSMAQIAASAIGAAYGTITVAQPDTDETPFDLMTSASRSTGAMGVAVTQAGDRLRQKLIELAVPLLEEPPDKLDADKGRVVSKSDPSLSVEFSEILQRHGLTDLTAEGLYQTDLGTDPETGQGIATPHWHQGAGACEVEVDIETGKVKVLHYFGSSYAGRVVHPTLVQLQNDGNVIFGLGPTFTEQVVYEHGQIANPDFADYKIPALNDLPLHMDTFSLETEDGELHGIGEMTLPPVAPAVGNAIRDALGILLYDLPLTAERVLRAFDEAKE